MTDPTSPNYGQNPWPTADASYPVDPNPPVAGPTHYPGPPSVVQPWSPPPGHPTRYPTGWQQSYPSPWQRPVGNGRPPLATTSCVVACVTAGLLISAAFLLLLLAEFINGFQKSIEAKDPYSPQLIIDSTINCLLAAALISSGVMIVHTHKYPLIWCWSVIFIVLAGLAGVFAVLPDVRVWLSGEQPAR